MTQSTSDTTHAAIAQELEKNKLKQPFDLKKQDLVEPYAIPYPKTQSGQSLQPGVTDVTNATLKQLVSSRPRLKKIAKMFLSLLRADRLFAEIFGRLDEGGLALNRLQAQVTHKVQEIDKKLEQLKSMQIQMNQTLEKISSTYASPLVNDATIDGSMSLDELYFHFENRFRGTREQIKKKVAVYLPEIKARNIDYQKYPVMDLGCGRGEWLEILKEAGIEARGVDSNAVMVGICQKADVVAVHADAMQYLRELPNHSCGGISGFHIVEHLSFQQLQALLKECRRVLIPGGFVLFETPNPENFSVASFGFYYDPTHQNPLPPESLSFFISTSGFRECKIIRLHPDEGINLDSIDNPLVKDLVQRFHGARDYAVFAWSEPVISSNKSLI